MASARLSLLFVAAGALAVGGATGRLLLDSMNDADTAVAEALASAADPSPPSSPTGGPTPPTAAPSPTPADSNLPHRLVLVVLDGLGEQPFLEAIRDTELAQYHFSAAVDVGTPSLSRPVYHVLLTGVPQSVSGIRSNAHTGPARADDVAARVREAGGSVGWALETVPWFHDLFGERGDRYERCGEEPLLHAVTDRFDEAPAPGDARFGAMARVLFTRPSLAVLHYTGVDHAGHHHGGSSEPYRQAALEAVRHVVTLRDAYRQTPEGSRTVWMLGADHGHVRRGGHGGPEPEVRRARWVGLWPDPATRRIDIPGVVPAERLAATFAAILGVPAPVHAIGDPLDLPDRRVRSSPGMDARRAAVASALGAAEVQARRGLLARSAVLVVGLFAFVAALVRRGKGGALAGAMLPSILGVSAFAVLGPGWTLSAIRTQAAFLSHSIGVLALGALLGCLLARRWDVRPAWGVAASALFPLAAYAVTAGSMGRCMLPDQALLVLPSMGLVPAGVLLGVAVALGISALRPLAQSAQEQPVKLRNS